MNALRALSLVVCGVVSLAACAKGTSVETTYAPGSGGAGGFGGDPSGDTASSGADETTGGGSTTSGTGGTGSGAGGDPATTSATSTSGNSSSSSTGSGGPGCDYTAINTCQASETMAAIDGDKNNDTRIVKGTTSKWFKVLVNEAVSSIINFPQLSYTASLVSPAGMDFDLFVYDGTTSTPSCSGNPTHAMGNPESVSETWGDTLNSDDTKWLTLEVRYISGDVCPADQWALTVKGHTN